MGNFLNRLCNLSIVQRVLRFFAMYPHQNMQPMLTEKIALKLLLEAGK